MKKYNNYKKYYETHREQEKKRTNAYYHEHKEEILAKRKAKRDAQPKRVKLTPVDYQEMWYELEERTMYIPFFRNLLFDIQLKRVNQKKEMNNNG